MGLARAQPALGPGPGDRAGWGRPGVHEEFGPACKRAGAHAGHPPSRGGGPQRYLGLSPEPNNWARRGGDTAGGVPGAEIRVN